MRFLRLSAVVLVLAVGLARAGAPMAAFETDPSPPEAGRETRVTVRVTDDAGGPLKGLEVGHERLAHFIFASENLEEFHHLHAEDFGAKSEELKATGKFAVKAVFAQGGKYLMGMDLVADGKEFHKNFSFEVKGPPQERTKWSSGRKAKADEVEVAMTVAPDPPRAGVKTDFSFEVSKGGAPAADLEPYLGAGAHIALFAEGKDGSEHLHGDFAGESGSPSGHGGHHGGAGGGSKVVFSHVFPEPGRYRLWVQLKSGGAPVTVPFDVEAASR